METATPEAPNPRGRYCKEHGGWTKQDMHKCSFCFELVCYDCYAILKRHLRCPRDDEELWRVLRPAIAPVLANRERERQAEREAARQ